MGDRSACGKIMYPTQVDALVALKAQELRVTAGSAASAPVRAYRCRRCRRWHLTSAGRR